MEFKYGPIEGGVVVNYLKPYADERGLLMELFRIDELTDNQRPVMAYLSATKPGIPRGPHEHHMQMDYFCFCGPGDFNLVLWDNRPTSLTYGNKMSLFVGEASPTVVLVPPHVVHAYRNMSDCTGYVLNAANQLYKGWKRCSAIDEIRHELNPESPFRLDWEKICLH